MNVKVMTSRFGVVEIDDDKIIEMPDGMIGFAERRFILLSSDNNDRFFWFQAVDNPALAFVVTDPTAYVSGYAVTLTPDEYERLELELESKEVILLAVTNISNGSRNITINLQGPVVVNPVKMIAKQIVLENGKYGIRHPLFTAPVPEPSPKKKEERTAGSPQKITANCSNL
jgi:flagellar assembly factor FliW